MVWNLPIPKYFCKKPRHTLVGHFCSLQIGNPTFWPKRISHKKHDSWYSHYGPSHWRIYVLLPLRERKHNLRMIHADTHQRWAEVLLINGKMGYFIRFSSTLWQSGRKLIPRIEWNGSLHISAFLLDDSNHMSYTTELCSKIIIYVVSLNCIAFKFSYWKIFCTVDVEYEPHYYGSH